MPGDNPSHALAAGTVAPAFTLPTTADQTVSLSDLRGAPVILAFYPADWSPVCSDQMGLYNEILPEFHQALSQIFQRVNERLIFGRTYAASSAKTSNGERLSFANCFLRIICATSMPAIVADAL
ncbi:peroxiredoxin family protein [Brucella sp. 21LCYQ03]|nr:peroxiredoxin family protein [Brucella sp. 21LCYQ03]